MKQRLLDHRVLFLHAFRPSAQTLPPSFVPCVRGEDAALRLYLTPTACHRLHNRRSSYEGPMPCSSSGFIVDRIEVAYLSDDLGVLAMGGRQQGRPLDDAKIPAQGRRAAQQRVASKAATLRAASQSAGAHTAGALLTTLDTDRLLGPLYPRQPLPEWTLAARRFPSLAQLIDELVPDALPIFSDLRLFTMIYSAFSRKPPPALCYGLCAIDPPTLPPPPADLVADFLRTRTYRRWEDAGTLYGFTHYSGSIIHTGATPDWLDRLLMNQYLDLASWVVGVAASRHQLVQGLAAGGALDPVRWQEHLQDYEHERFSEQDQGRQLVRLWLSIIEDDYRDLAFLGGVHHARDRER